MSLRSVVVATVLAGAGLLIPQAATAQSEDFTINIENSHFNPVPAGGLADYNVRINSGNTPTDPTKVTFIIPENTDYEGVVGLDNCALTEGPPMSVTCDVPALPAQSAVSATVNLRHNAEGTTTFTATLDDGTAFSRDTTVQRGADLELSLDADPATVKAGDYASFVARVTNKGPYPSGAATLEVTIPTGFSRDVVLPNGCSVDGALIRCDVETLADGASTEFAFRSQAMAAQQSVVTELPPNR